MKVKLAYPNYIVEVTENEVYLFNGKLVSAPLDEVLYYAYGKDAVLPEELKKVAHDVLRVFNIISGEGNVSKFVLSDFSRGVTA
ncbi:hypothetical protein E3E31_05145 [Thermococcus sp. M39]|uniref:hypothetical protein n=1 Tax=unclassified Thermococcus TaxID=2627626 RepID=UPI0014391A7E|nr:MULTISPECIES: hypothetical protein [unclassified Thermococcus]NJE07911.1 hypothetical protein [Thermococcus sp. M39]NJE13379.1 hypothetical protein [Thermococcus sp. LS2]